MRESVFGVEQSVPPLVDPVTGLLVSEPDWKAELSMRTFEAKQSSRILELPPTCHQQPVLRGVAFRSRKIRELLSGFDSYSGKDSLGFFPCFIRRMLVPSLLNAPKFRAFCYGVVYFRNAGGRLTSPPYQRVLHRPLPISITPVLSKVYEKVISCCMFSHLIQKGVFSGCQFAYRSGRGTCDLLLTLEHVLQSSLDPAAEVRVVQLDFSAAYDRVNHSGLIFKLKSVGVGGPVMSVLEQFLSSRRHRVCVLWTVALVDGRMLYLVYLRVVSWGLFFLCCTLLICLKLSTVKYTVMQTIQH